MPQARGGRPVALCGRRGPRGRGAGGRCRAQGAEAGQVPRRHGHGARQGSCWVPQAGEAEPQVVP
uniref:Uncharacterized protein n=1 Tax=Arundo donax TaxID=35708 RepID=A0A0A9CYH5_ARUDO